jgi:hypothetical protein
MGTLFPAAGGEHPNHVSIPCLLASMATDLQVATCVILLSAAYGLCPATEEKQPHAHEREFVEHALPSAALNAAGGGDVTVALTGVRAEAQVGTFGVALTIG